MAVSVLVGVAIGYAAAASQYSAQFNKIKKAFPSQGIITSVSGTVKSISGNVLTIEASQPFDPFGDEPAIREITVTGNTSIVRREIKDSSEFQQEMSDFQKQLQKIISAQGVPAGTSTVAAPVDTQAPLPYNEIAISVSDLKIGSIISAESDKDIRTASAFEAVKISLIGAPATNGVPTPNVSSTPSAVNNQKAPASAKKP